MLMLGYKISGYKYKKKLHIPILFRYDLSDFRYLQYNNLIGNALRIVFQQFHFLSLQIIHTFAPLQHKNTLYIFNVEMIYVIPT